MRAAFHGCSFTYGEGFSEDQRKLHAYPYLIAEKLQLDADNLACPGNSNYRIFMQASESILKENYDIVFCQWTALNRIWLHPGPDCSFFTNSYKDFHYRDIHLTAKEKNKFVDTLMLMNHDYQNIHDLIDYCSILGSMAECTNTKLYHINGLVPWERDLLSDATSIDALSQYTRSMLDFDNRDDQEIVLFFKKLQTKFQNINQSLWINLFESFQKNTIDSGPEGHHPGTKSHQWMANKIYNHIS